MVEHTALGVQQRLSPNPFILHTYCQWALLPNCFQTDDMVNSKSVVEYKPGVSGVVIWYQVNEFPHT